jgi:hypothetical protein
VHAYNTNKKFHPKSDDKVGFVISVTNNRIYHAGDTDLIPEMETIRPDIAFVPVSGTYVMNAEEAAKAVNELLKAHNTYALWGYCRYGRRRKEVQEPCSDLQSRNSTQKLKVSNSLL